LDSRQLIWLFFSFSGRVDRQVFALAGLLLYLARIYPFYRVIAAGDDQAAATAWAGVFLIAVLGSLFSHIALAAKRLHDFDRPGWFAAFFLVGDLFVFIGLCIPVGTPGPNQYGATTNAPA
jgi:uncharacterized membrane protein YhaH (DUF805 family)